MPKPPRSKVDVTDRAIRAVSEFRKLQPTMTAFARILTGDPKVHVVLSSQSNGHTTGQKIHMRPPIEMGDRAYQMHDRELCDVRDEKMQQRCRACRIRERLMSTTYHEISHIAYDSIGVKVRPDRQSVSELLHRHLAAKQADRMMAQMPHSMTSFMQPAQYIHPAFTTLLNCVEDARINLRMGDARPGTWIMRAALVIGIATDGVPNGDDAPMFWRDMPFNHQIAVAAMIAAEGHDIDPSWFGDEVLATVRWHEVQAILDKVPYAKDVRGAFEITVELFAQLKKMGYFKMEDDEEPEPTPEPEPSDETGEEGNDGNDEAEQDDSDGSDEADSDEDADGGGSDEPSDADDSEPADGGSSEADDADAAPEEEEAGGSDGGDDAEPRDAEPSDGDDGDAGDEDSAEAGSEGSDDADADAEPEPQDQGDGSAPEAQDEQSSGASDPGSAEDGTGSDGEPSDPSDDASEADAGSGQDGGEGEGAPSGMAGGAGEPPSASNGDDGAVPDSGDASADASDSDDLDDSEASEPGSEAELTNEADDAEALDYQPNNEQGGVKVNETEDVMPVVETEIADPMTDEAPDLVDLGFHPEEADASAVETAAIERALVQGLYFESPSRTIGGVNVWSHDKADMERQSRPYHAWGTQTRHDRLYGTTGIEELGNAELGPALMRMRLVFDDNKRTRRSRNMKSGRIVSRTLGKRAPFGDDRLFGRKAIPAKKDYAVVLGIDISGSTRGANIKMAKEAALAQGDLLDRMGIKFAIYAHSATPTRGNYHGADGNLYLDMYECKSFDDPWTSKQRDAVKGLSSSAANLDGHSVEFYRKLLDTRSETDRIIMYYSDGAMPAENYDEELEILKREIKTCGAKGYTLMAVGIRTDDPTAHGLDTVQIDSSRDVRKVIDHLEKRLSA